jgi:hypothetical protein
MAESFGGECDQWCVVLIVVERDGSLVLVVEPTRQAVPCPMCGELSQRPHSSYERRPLDLPWFGATPAAQAHGGMRYPVGQGPWCYSLGVLGPPLSVGI